MSNSASDGTQIDRICSSLVTGTGPNDKYLHLVPRKKQDPNWKQIRKIHYILSLCFSYDETRMLIYHHLSSESVSYRPAAHQRNARHTTIKNLALKRWVAKLLFWIDEKPRVHFAYSMPHDYCRFTPSHAFHPRIIRLEPCSVANRQASISCFSSQVQFHKHSQLAFLQFQHVCAKSILDHTSTRNDSQTPSLLKMNISGRHRIRRISRIRNLMLNSRLFVLSSILNITR